MIHHGDCIEVMATLDAESVDAIVTDPPYGLEFMGKSWDGPWKRGDDVTADAGVKPVRMADGADRLDRPSFNGSSNPRCRRCGGTQRGRDRKGFTACKCPQGGDFPPIRLMESRAMGEWHERWAREAYRVAKPGAHLLAFGGTRTYHRLAAAIEDAGWEVRDCLVWAYASGFPKSHNLGGEWQGWGTALKPAWEPIVLARKPLRGTVAANVERYGTGALNIDATRIGVADGHGGGAKASSGFVEGYEHDGFAESTQGRWPANLILTDPIFDGDAPGVVGGGEQSGGGNPRWRSDEAAAGSYGGYAGGLTGRVPVDTEGTYSRFFLIAKADRGDREPLLGGLEPAFRRNVHPTVKPTELMRHLVRLVTPPGGVVLDPFLGSGTTALACEMEGFGWVGIEREAEYVAIAEARLNGVQRGLGLTG